MKQTSKIFPVIQSNTGHYFNNSHLKHKTPMTREIRFRYWYSGKMIDVGSVEFFTDGTCLVNEELIGGVFMRYTGLKDKNGTPIYENDIVKLHDTPTGIDDCITYVVFKDGCFVADYNGLPIKEYGTARTEVIGNIHQNPELL